MRSILRAIAASTPVAFSSAALAIWTPPGERWEQYADPTEAGWDAAKLAAAREFADDIGSASVMIVHRGVVVDAWGDLTRRYMCHSTRKSFMSALLGVFIEDGVLDYNLTLADLGIDDAEPALSDIEKSARIVDLMAARSGVYRTAAYEPPSNPKPDRHAHAPNEQWCYNNWDFNTLSTIFRQITGRDVFEAFDDRIARPLQMEDFAPRDGYYHYQRHMSEHPAYPFRMSTRDMARFGQLFLNQGWWGDQPILSEGWIEESTDSISSDTMTGGYGYMWWTYQGTDWERYGLYTALGAGGHAIAVFPKLDLVIVHRVNTFVGMNVQRDDFMALFDLIIDALPIVVQDADLQILVDGETSPEGVDIPLTELLRFVGSYDVPDGRVRVSCEGNRLVLHLPQSGAFDMIPTGEHTFTLDDSYEQYIFEQHDGAWTLFGEHHAMQECFAPFQRGELDACWAKVEEHLQRFPRSSHLHAMFGNIEIRRENAAAAITHFSKAAELEPTDVRFANLVEQLEAQIEAAVPAETT